MQLPPDAPRPDLDHYFPDPADDGDDPDFLDLNFYLDPEIRITPAAREAHLKSVLSFLAAYDEHEPAQS